MTMLENVKDLDKNQLYLNFHNKIDIDKKGINKVSGSLYRMSTVVQGPYTFLNFLILLRYFYIRIFATLK